MNLQQLKCPACGAGINLTFEGEKEGFCPYCGSKFVIDDGNRMYTENINKNISFHTVWTDEAEIEKEKRLDRENERDHRETLYILGFLILLIVLLFIMTRI